METPRIPLPNGELPPSLRFWLTWADPDSLPMIMAEMQRERRQTMNLRLMPKARLLLLQRLEDRFTIGWGGVDVDHDPRRPEVFSLYVMPEYRTYTLGLLIELIRYTYLRRLGFKFAYVRMEADGNFSLLKYRVDRGLYKPRVLEEIEPEYVGMCHKCELFGNDCKKQAYFTVDIENFIQTAERRLGPVDVQELPRPFELRPEIIRQAVRPDGKPETKQPYKPHWL